jgi:hypothetical protein
MWRGYEISTGPLDFALDDSTGMSCGVMNYELGLVLSEFHVLVRFRRFLPDHRFNGGLRGSCKVESHKMFSGQDLRIEILPGL